MLWKLLITAAGVWFAALALALHSRGYEARAALTRGRDGFFIREDGLVDGLPLILLLDFALSLLQLLDLCLGQDGGLVILWCGPFGAYVLGGQVFVDVFSLSEFEVAAWAGDERLVSAIEVLPMRQSADQYAVPRQRGWDGMGGSVEVTKWKHLLDSVCCQPSFAIARFPFDAVWTVTFEEGTGESGADDGRESGGEFGGLCGRRWLAASSGLLRALHPLVHERLLHGRSATP